MAVRGPRLEFAVGAFLLLALASLLVLASGLHQQEVRLRQQQLRTDRALQQPGPAAPAGAGEDRRRGRRARWPKIKLDPVKFDSIVTLDINNEYKDLPADTSAGIFTSGLLGENYIGLSPGGDPEVLKPGEEIAFTQPAVDLLQLVGKYMFSGGGKPAGSGDASGADASAPPAATPPTEEPVQMKKSLLSLVIASALLAGAPALALAQAAAAAAPAAQGSASKVVLDSSTRILTTLEQRRAEFRKDPGGAQAIHHQRVQPHVRPRLRRAPGPGRAWPRRFGCRREAVRRCPGRQPDRRATAPRCWTSTASCACASSPNRRCPATAGSRSPARCCAMAATRSRWIT